MAAYSGEVYLNTAKEFAALPNDSFGISQTTVYAIIEETNQLENQVANIQAETIGSSGATSSLATSGSFVASVKNAYLEAAKAHELPTLFTVEYQKPPAIMG